MVSLSQYGTESKGIYEADAVVSPNMAEMPFHVAAGKMNCPFHLEGGGCIKVDLAKEQQRTAADFYGVGCLWV